MKKMYNQKQKIISVIDNHIINYKVYYITISIMIMVYISCLMISSGFPMGKLIPISGDGLMITYPSIASQYDNIKNGEALSFYTFDSAGFVDVYRSNVLSYIIYPYVLLRNCIFPKKFAIYLMILDYLANFIFPSISIIYYLTHKYSNKYNIKDMRLIAYGIMYGLSNYALTFYIYKDFLYLQMLPILVLGLEYLLYKKRPTLFISILTFQILSDPYHAFLLCEFIALLFLVYKFDSFKDFIIKGLRFATASIISALLSAFTLVPFYLLSVNDSPYLTNDSIKPSLFFFFGSYIKTISNYHIANFNSSVSEDNSIASIYIGLILLFIIPLYILYANYTYSLKIKKIALLVTLYISFNNELLNYIFHGFHFQNMVPNRHAAFFVFLSITIIADTLITKRRINNKSIIYSILLTSTIITCIYCYYLNLNKFTSILSLCVVLTYVVIAIYYGLIKNTSSRILYRYLLYITIIEMIINSLFNFSTQFVSNSKILKTSNEIDKIVDYYPDMKKFYNSTELLGDNDDLLNIGYSSNINSLSYFNNTFTSYTIQRIIYYNVQCGVNNFSYKGGNPLADMMLHVKYQIEDINDDTAFSIYPEILQHNDYSIHENPYYISLGFVLNNCSIYDNNIKIQSDSCFEQQNSLSKYMGGKNIYNKINIINIEDLKNTEKEFDTNNNYFMLSNTYEETNTNSTKTKYQTVNIHLNEKINGYIYISVENHAYCIGEANENNHDFTVDYPYEIIKNTNNFHPIIAVFNEENFKELHDLLDNNVLYNLENNGRSIKGEFDVTGSGALYISLPYYEGWTIYIDGKKKEKEYYLGGIGINVTPGHHSIEMKYRPPGMIPGILISGLTLIIIIVFNIIIFKKKEKTHIK